MALIECPDCGKEYSSRATVCPNCGCPNDYKSEKEVKELQADVTLAIKVDIKKEIILRIAIVVIAAIIFFATGCYEAYDNLIDSLNNNLCVLLLIMCLIVSLVKGFRSDGIAGAIGSPIGLIIVYFIVMLIGFYGIKLNMYLLNWGFCAMYAVPYFLQPLPLFIKHNVLKQDVDLKSLTGD